LGVKYRVKNVVKTNVESDEEKEFIFNTKLLKVIMYLEKLRLEGLANNYRVV
jgi:hypothetical protein